QWRRMRGRSAQALVARWMLPPGLSYEEARELYAPFDRLVNENPGTRGELAELVLQAVGGGQPGYVNINNKAEGGAPGSVGRPAGLRDHQQQGRGERAGEHRTAGRGDRRAAQESQRRQRPPSLRWRFALPLTARRSRRLPGHRGPCPASAA